ncbi:unnamed protein product [Musa hybrid cultivar]
MHACMPHHWTCQSCRRNDYKKPGGSHLRRLKIHERASFDKVSTASLYHGSHSPLVKPKSSARYSWPSCVSCQGTISPIASAQTKSVCA